MSPSREAGSDRLKRYREWLFKLELTEDAARQANARRDEMLRSLTGNPVHYGYGRSKIHYKELSPGCETCGRGTWSCLFVNSLCTANCFFCPQDRVKKDEDPPSAEGLVFDDPDAYLSYLELCGFTGVGFSGGEPLLVLHKLLSFIRSIKRRFGDAMYVWMYTNGDLIDVDTLADLRRAGLDEIRFNISARQYDLDAVELACGLMNSVAVEIPAIPEDCGRVKDCLRDLQALGVRHLNLHQLSASEYNYKSLIRRNYTMVPSFCHPPVVFESEMAALDLARHASDERLNISVNYCSEIYKARYQQLAHRKRAATLARHGCERITDAGFISCASVEGSVRNGTLRYYEADIVPRESADGTDLEMIRGINLGRDKQVLVGRKLVAEVDVQDSGGAGQEQRDVPDDLRGLEQIDAGLSEIRSSRSLWQHATALARRRQER